jgi:hypothetical protein
MIRYLVQLARLRGNCQLVEVLRSLRIAEIPTSGRLFRKEQFNPSVLSSTVSPVDTFKTLSIRSVMPPIVRGDPDRSRRPEADSAVS